MFTGTRREPARRCACPDDAQDSYALESECWVLDERWFVVVWRNDTPGNLELLEHLGLPVPVPLRTQDGSVNSDNRRSLIRSVRLSEVGRRRGTSR